MAAVDWGETALHRAALAGDEVALARILKDGGSLEARDILGFTALHVAAAEGKGGAVEALLSAGAAVDARSADDLTPLMLACRRAHLAAVERLCAGGAELRTKTPGSPSVLDFAAQARNLPLLERLSEAGLSVPDGRRAGYFRLVLELTGHKVRFVTPGASWGSSGETPSVWAVDRPMRVPSHLLQPIGGHGPLNASWYAPQHYQEFESRPDTFASDRALNDQNDPERLGGGCWATDWVHEVRAARANPLKPIPDCGISPLGAAIDRRLTTVVVALLCCAGLDPSAVAAEPSPLVTGTWDDESRTRLEERGLLPRHLQHLGEIIEAGLKGAPRAGAD